MKPHTLCTIIQIGKLTDERYTALGTLNFENNNYEVIVGENNFKELDNTKSRLSAVIEYEDDTAYEIFDLTLIPNSDFDEFIIVQDQEYHNMNIFFMHKELNENLNPSQKNRNTKKI